MDKYDINEIRQSIHYPNSRINELSQWRFYGEANCYQFALNAQFYIPIYEHRLLPGEISGHIFSSNMRFLDEEIIEFVKRDVRYIGFEIEECEQDCVIEDNKKWKIAIMNCDVNGRSYDFHFLRQTFYTENGIWLHKFPEEQQPSELDYNGNTITDPAKAKFFCPYHVVGYYCISQKK